MMYEVDDLSPMGKVMIEVTSETCSLMLDKFNLPWGVPDRAGMVLVLDRNGLLNPCLSKEDKAALLRQKLLEEI